jgi:hypothetical protein
LAYSNRIFSIPDLWVFAYSDANADTNTYSNTNTNTNAYSDTQSDTECAQQFER